MCDPTPVRNWIWAVITAAGAAVACITVAAILNGSFFGALAAPAWMVAAAAATGAALYCCGRALGELAKFCDCAGRQCSGPCSNMRNVLRGVEVVLGIQVGACLAAAGVAWIPWVGLAPMYAIMGTLTAQVALLLSALVFVVNLYTCARAG